MGKLVTERVDNRDPLIQIALKELDKECFSSPDEAPPRVETGTWWIVKDGKVPVAYACIRPSTLSGWGYMSRSGVIEAYRGRGLQKRLVRVRLAYAKKMGWRGVLSDTAKDNVASSNNLMQCGFRLFRPATPWSFDSALYWRLEF